MMKCLAVLLSYTKKRPIVRENEIISPNLGFCKLVSRLCKILQRALIFGVQVAHLTDSLLRSFYVRSLDSWCSLWVWIQILISP